MRDLIVLIGARPEDLMHGGITVQRRVEKIHQDLRKFRDAFEVRDDVTAADVAQHELRPAIDSWRAWLQDVGKVVQRLGNRAGP